LIGVEFVQDGATLRPAPAFHRAVHRAAVRRGVVGITEWGKWVYRLQPAIDMDPDLFRWSCRTVVDAIHEVREDPPPEAPHLLDLASPPDAP
jgi:4-aminobutyrate aminotransferase-like enzyme